MGSKLALSMMSRLEWQIMNYIWDTMSASTREVMEILPQKPRRAYTTVQTYMERMVEKGYLSKEKLGLVNYYTARIVQENEIDSATTNLIETVFRGSEINLVAHLINRGKLNQNELIEIKDRLELGAKSN